MRKYGVVALEIENDFIWGVVENATDQLIETFYFEDEALDTASFYEHGGAFDGFTPMFMLRKAPLKTDLNEAFEQKFMV